MKAACARKIYCVKNPLQVVLPTQRDATEPSAFTVMSRLNSSYHKHSHYVSLQWSLLMHGLSEWFILDMYTCRHNMRGSSLHILS